MPGSPTMLPPTIRNQFINQSTAWFRYYHIEILQTTSVSGSNMPANRDGMQASFRNAPLRSSNGYEQDQRAFTFEYAAAYRATSQASFSSGPPLDKRLFAYILQRTSLGTAAAQ